MKVVVDFDCCVSTGSCARVAPEVFELRDDGYLYVLQEEPPEALHDQVREAAELCPTGAIKLE
ncbi:MAG TPA: ferredoxin [Acidimicrobiales bacterium]|nr:ferredoxin [Acidimicrobiales bacterium]